MRLKRKLSLFLNMLFFSCALSVFAQEKPPFAVLKNGPEQQWGLPGFERNMNSCLHGSYSLSDGAAVKVWAVPATPAYDNLWMDSKLISGLPLLKRDATLLYSARIKLKNQYPAMRGALDWTIVFEFSASVTDSDKSSFISFFIPRFEYFGSIAKGIEDISFPAVLGTGKN